MFERTCLFLAGNFTTEASEEQTAIEQFRGESESTTIIQGLFQPGLTLGANGSSSLVSFRVKLNSAWTKLLCDLHLLASWAHTHHWLSPLEIVPKCLSLTSRWSKNRILMTRGLGQMKVWGSLAHKLPPTPSEKPRDRRLKNQRGDPWKKNINFFKKSSKYNETWFKSSKILYWSK